MLQLLYSPTSPYVRKVMVCAHLTGQIDHIELLDSAAHPVRRDGRIAAHNPLAKIPTLILEDGQSLYDSRVICEYLASLAPQAQIFPAQGPARWQALVRQALGDGLLDAALLARYEQNARPAQFQWEVWRQALLTKISACLGAIDNIADGLDGQPADIGHITLGCALAYLDFRFPDLNWRAEHSHAASWSEAFQRLPAMQATQAYEA